jgi:elongation factor Ts
VNITSQMVKELREKTNAGMMDCKKALTDTDGDMEKAVDLLRQKGLAVAAKRAGKETREGVIEAYIHAGGKIDDFRAFARNIAMHVAAVSPLSVSRDEVPADVVQREKDIYINQALESGKPQQIAEKMVAGKLEKFLAEVCLLEQKYVKNPDLSVQDLLNELVAKMGENISIKKFARFQIG